MKDDKKKLVIVGVLAAIVVAVGAFQFIGGGSGGGAKKPIPAKKPDVVAAPEENKIKNPEFANKLPERDPFKSPDDVPTKPVLPTAPAKQAPRSLPGNLANNGVLPNAGFGTIAPLSVAPPEPVFNYRLSGLILGRHPAAVFTDTGDKSGSQRLVPIGGSLDGDTQLVAVTKGLAVVSFHGKHRRLTLGGTPDAN